MTTSHTPGPWIIEPHDGYQLIRADDGHGTFARVKMRGTKTNNTTELYHNAHLIAAAPDMLEALYQARDWFDAGDGRSSGPVGDTIRAAIVKAEGRS